MKGLSVKCGSTMKFEEMPMLTEKLKDQTEALEQVMYDTALFGRIWRWRYPFGRGGCVPDFTFDVVSYFDLVLSDLGSRSCQSGRHYLILVYRELS